MEQTDDELAADLSETRRPARACWWARERSRSKRSAACSRPACSCAWLRPRRGRRFGELAAEGKLEWVEREFEPADLDGNFIVIAATDVPEVNAAVYREAVARGIPCNSVDDIPNCDFFFGSVVSRGDLQIAISTAGESPAVAQRLRREIDEQLPAGSGPVAREARRAAARGSGDASARRRAPAAAARAGAAADLRLGAVRNEAVGADGQGSGACCSRQRVSGWRGAGRSGAAHGEGGAADRERRRDSARRSGAAGNSRLGARVRTKW